MLYTFCSLTHMSLSALYLVHECKNKDKMCYFGANWVWVKLYVLDESETLTLHYLYRYIAKNGLLWWDWEPFEILQVKQISKMITMYLKHSRMHSFVSLFLCNSTEILLYIGCRDGSPVHIVLLLANKYLFFLLPTGMAQGCTRIYFPV